MLRVLLDTIQFQQSVNFNIRLSCVCVWHASRTLQETPRVMKSAVMCLYRLMVWKRQHPVQCWSIMGADTKTMPLLYRISLPGNTGINRYKVVLKQNAIFTFVFTGKLNLYETHTASPPPVIRTYVFVGWYCLINKNNGEKEGKYKYIFYSFILPTSIMIKIVSEYKLIDRYYYIIAEFLDWL